MKRLFALALVVALAGCNSRGGGGASAPVQSSLTPADLSPALWSIANGGATLSSDGGLAFTFPAASPGVNYLTTPVSAIAGARLSAAYRIIGTDNPYFDYRTSAGNTCEGQATVRLYFQRAGDDWSATGPMQQYRYFSTPVANLAPGSMTLSAPLTSNMWIDLAGQPGSMFPDRFAAALASASAVGMVYGGGCFAGHGVFVPLGTAQFVLAEFRIVP